MPDFNPARLLRWFDDCNTYDPAHFVDFSIAGTPVGAVHREMLPLLQEQPSVFHVAADRVALHPRLKTPAARTEAVEAVLWDWHERGVFSGWRGERYRVATAFDAPPLMGVERSAAGFFGIVQYGMHLNGIVQEGEVVRMWVARRALDKPEYPGRLDHLVAGGIAEDMGVWPVVIKECGEEADIPPALAQQARPVGIVSYRKEKRRKLKRTMLFNYDLVLPPDFAPRNTDGEVDRFFLWPIERVMATLAETDEFKTNCNLVIIDFLVRHGYLTPEHAHYTEIARRLCSPATL